MTAIKSHHYIRPGVDILIKRSDGRIHKATVSEVRTHTKSVCVEWRELNETKGKEVLLEVIYDLNPLLVSKQINSSTEAKQKEDQIKKQLADINQDQIKIIKQSDQQEHQIKTAKQLDRLEQMEKLKLNNEYRKTILMRRSNEKVENIRLPPVSSENDDKSPVKSDNKKSNCLKEVEKIARNREKRRQQQKKLHESHDNGFNLNNIDQKRLIRFSQMIEQYRKKQNADKCQLTTINEFSRITVSVRKRPLTQLEKRKGELDIVTIIGNDVCVVHSPKEKVDLTEYLDNHNFKYDYSFDEHVQTISVYETVVKPLIQNVIDGNHAMCFAYGQTGSGKTYTMGGTIQKNGRVNCSTGVYAFATKELFGKLSNQPNKFSLFCSFFEIYCGKVFDLFNRRKRLQVLEDQNNVIQIVGIKQEHVRTVEDVINLLEHGMSLRTSGTTSANENSSRSHAVFRISLKQNSTGSDYSRLSLIDLAGSERGKDTSSSNRSTVLEGAEINKSLLALKECIRALAVKADHIPFRGSILTRVLRDSFIGLDSMLSMIVMISPSHPNSEHTLNTLRYADRVKELNTNELSNDCQKSSADSVQPTIISVSSSRRPLSDSHQHMSKSMQSNFKTSSNKSFTNKHILSLNDSQRRRMDSTFKAVLDSCLNGSKVFNKNLSEIRQQTTSDKAGDIRKRLHDQICEYIKQLTVLKDTLCNHKIENVQSKSLTVSTKLNSNIPSKVSKRANTK